MNDESGKLDMVLTAFTEKHGNFVGFIDFFLKTYKTCGIIIFMEGRCFEMMVSTRGRYALRMMIDLAVYGQDGFIALKDIAERQNISKKYLEQIIPIMNRSGMLKTSRGFGGGYQLAREPKEYTVGEILRAVEGSMAPVTCLEGAVNPCPRCSECATLPVWEGLQKVVDEYLDGITLQDLIKQNK